MRQSAVFLPSATKILTNIVRKLLVRHLDENPRDITLNLGSEFKIKLLNPNQRVF
jgi:hypothetical protein